MYYKYYSKSGQLLGLVLLYSLLTSCIKPLDVYVANLEQDPEKSYHAAYLRETYGETKRDESYYAYKGILSGEYMKRMYDEIYVELDSSTFKSLPKLIAVYKEHLGLYALMWKRAISQSVSNRLGAIKFNPALAIYMAEYSRIGVFESADKVDELLQAYFKGIDPVKMPKTYELYGVISMLRSQVREPTGSLNSFSQNINDVNYEFTKAYSMAQLEN